MPRRSIRRCSSMQLVRARYGLRLVLTCVGDCTRAVSGEYVPFGLDGRCMARNRRGKSW